MWSTDSPIEFQTGLSRLLGVQLFVKRDDLLPHPLAGNKFRKLRAEMAGRVKEGDLVISNGGIGSNHCRTLAFLGAEQGFDVHLILHSEGDQSRDALRLLGWLRAAFTIVPVEKMSSTIVESAKRFRRAGRTVHVIAGGCHTRRGAIAYRRAGEAVLRKIHPQFVVLASGTGATQGGIVAAVEALAVKPDVMGISVARPSSRGAEAVVEAASWAGACVSDVSFFDDYRDGGYGHWSQQTVDAVALGWRHGLPLDPTYTGKAFAGLLDQVRTARIPQHSKVLFWHTGGLWNALTSNLGELSNDQSGRCSAL